MGRTSSVIAASSIVLGCCNLGVVEHHIFQGCWNIASGVADDHTFSGPSDHHTMHFFRVGTSLSKSLAGTAVHEII